MIRRRGPPSQTWRPFMLNHAAGIAAIDFIMVPTLTRACILAMACGYEDANDLDRLRFDPAIKLACGRLPDSGLDLCSQPTMSRWENALKSVCANNDGEPRVTIANAITDYPQDIFH